MVVDTCLEAYLDTYGDTLGLFDSRSQTMENAKCVNWLADTESDSKARLNTPSSMNSQDASSTLDVISEILFADDCGDSYTPGKKNF